MRHLAEFRRVILQDRGHGLGRRIAAKSALARDHLVEHRAKSKNVGAGIDRSTTNLLRRHIAGRAHHHSSFRRRTG
jgi:hypothetical protein